MKYYLFRCEGCNIIKGFGAYGGKKAAYMCKVCKGSKLHVHIQANESDMCQGVVESGEKLEIEYD